jgi:hypothetical protein
MPDIIVEATGLPLRFPDGVTEARARAEEFRRMAPEERWGEIVALMALGLNLARSSPRHVAIAQRWEAQEAEWQRLQKTIFAKHVQ